MTIGGEGVRIENDKGVLRADFSEGVFEGQKAGKVRIICYKGCPH